MIEKCEELGVIGEHAFVAVAVKGRGGGGRIGNEMFGVDRNMMDENTEITVGGGVGGGGAVEVQVEVWRWERLERSMVIV